MKRAFFTGLGLLACSFAAEPVVAADRPAQAPIVKAPVAAPLFNWSGFYVGAHGGYAWGDADVDDNTFGSFASPNPSGGFGGLQLGYNRQLNSRWVIGYEVDLSAADISDTAPTSLAPEFNTTKIDYFGTARTRIGYAWDRTLLYATGGLAWARVTSDSTDILIDTRAHHIGWTIGAGIEHAFASNWSAKLEYLYADFDDFIDASGTPNSSVTVTASLVRVGLNYRFGAPPTPAPVLPVKAAPASAPSWDGRYVGIHGAGAWGDLTYSSTTAIVGRTDLEPSGWLGGVQTGYNWQFAPNLVLGIESDFAFGTIDGSGLSTTGNSDKVEIDKFGTVRLRYGYATANTLAYATGGLAYAHIDYSGGVVPVLLVSRDNHHLGWTAGVGVEYAFAPNWTMKLEYLYADLGRAHSTSGTSRNVTDLDLNIVKFGINYRGPILEALLGR